ncbi:hypothetical protein [Streptomyces sp. MUSC 14]|uniref:hypothetical protein n=1 Tax=Streptomyces sp. MUSC 14 TaxID=1354889 RepID=UPI0015A65D5E|nr:hypothetical protein [Streptomyces sp. MUSC 14]
MADALFGTISLIGTYRDTLVAAAASPVRRRPVQYRCACQRPWLPAPVGLCLQLRPRPRLLVALEGIGSYGTGLAAFLNQSGERVAEVRRCKRSAVRGGRKTYMIDAIRAAKEAGGVRPSPMCDSRLTPDTARA